MIASLQSCPDCQCDIDVVDNYCRNCGMYLAGVRKLTVVEPSLPMAAQRQPASLPVPVRRAVTALAVGAAVQVGISVAGKYLARQAAKQALAAPARVRSGGPARRAVSAASDVPDDVAAVSETVVVHRSWVRR